MSGETVFAVVVVSGALHAAWNAIAKQVDERLVLFALIGVPMTVFGAVTVAAGGPPGRAAMAFCVGSAMLHVVYDMFLMWSYRHGALNQVYPIARGTSPLCVTAGGVLVAGDRLPLIVLAGIVVLAASILALARAPGPRMSRRPVYLALSTGVLIASYSVVDGVGVRHASSSVAYAGLLFLLLGPVFPLALFARRRTVLVRRYAWTGAAAGVLSVAAYALVLWAQSRAALGVVAALRETSVVFSAMIGAFVLGEPFGSGRIAASIGVASGVALIYLA